MSYSEKHRRETAKGRALCDEFAEAECAIGRVMLRVITDVVRDG